MITPPRRWLPLCCAALICVLTAIPAQAADGEADDDYLPKSWKEIETQLPPAPLEHNLQAIYLNEVAQNKFFIDSENLRIDADGVVRYVLVVLTPGGARNVTYEGMRCETRQWRIYASGRADGAWSKARRAEWQPIHDEAINRYHAALFLDYFCIGGVIADNVEAARKALRGR
ncbi:MAG: CNP1-like family protein [Betaproteobacteria bacterium]|nr:CNP1-like family protein [Betaproteobacteria bacterium]MCL2887386.1 CNP1-like family protein [Betaproteobacteria bacterium]